MNFPTMEMDSMRLGTIAAAGALLIATAGTVRAQRAVTRADVVAAALARGPRIVFARADSTAAHAGLSIASQFENPIFGLSYSKSVPQQHFAVDVPLDYPWLRKARVGAAASGLGAARYRFDFERAAVTFEADTAYTNALAAAKRAEFSRGTARYADSVLTLARLRRDAGDGSELDLQLASVSLGQIANAAARDSLNAIAAVLAVQALMGLGSDALSLVLADTLEAGGIPTDMIAGTQLLVAAAEEELKQADQALTLEKRLLFAAPSLTVGWEQRDPTGAESGTLPTVGIALPLPLFNQNRGTILLAQSQRDRAEAALAVARLEGAQQAARARRELALARDRLARSERLVAAANLVAQLSLLAYREGASALPNVLEAQRIAREALSQYVDDVAAARNAAGLVRLLTLTVHRNDQ
jgi:cobalt-zinc-cadmium efflux system outer membrane protein